MLIEFRVANFRSIREEQFLSMVPSLGKEHPGNTFETGIKRYLWAERRRENESIEGPPIHAIGGCKFRCASWDQPR
jgi:AAA15 family ATPase/GTPase